MWIHSHRKWLVSGPWWQSASRYSLTMDGSGFATKQLNDQLQPALAVKQCDAKNEISKDIIIPGKTAGSIPKKR